MKVSIQLTPAEQIRAMGLKVGDCIEGREAGSRWWAENRLTLLWCGHREAAWLVSARSHDSPTWSEPVEQVGWNLGCREWQLAVREDLIQADHPVFG
jgi:hypothetical protein